VALTIKDVAQAAGVSTATVSRALRGLGNVDPRTRDRIVAIADEMKFSISPTASRLATGRTGTVGIVTLFIGRWYFTEILAGIDDAMRRHDIDLLVHSTGLEMPRAHPLQAHERMRRRVDGVLAIGFPADSRELDLLAELNAPLVLVGAAHATIPCVCIDDRAAARTAVTHLVEAGCRRIGLISGRTLPAPYPPENERLAGYVDVLTEHGLATDMQLRVPGAFTVTSGEAAMNRLLAQRPRPDGVFAMSDEMAFGALRALHRHGLKPGEDVRVIGFDGHDLAEAFDLSTVAQPAQAIGFEAAEMLMARIHGKAPNDSGSVVLPTHLQARGSTGT